MSGSYIPYAEFADSPRRPTGFAKAYDWRSSGSRLITGASFLCLGFLFGTGCGPSISRFELTPQVFCEGERPMISWDARGDTTMIFAPEPLQAGADSCVATGRNTFDFTLVSRRGGKEARREVEAMQLAETGAEPISFETTAVAGDEVIADGEKNVVLWADHIRIATVAACGGRAVSVEHEGKRVSLPPGGVPSDELAGTPLVGLWKLRSQLSLDERNNPSLRPKALAILATFHCVKETR